MGFCTICQLSQENSVFCNACGMSLNGGDDAPKSFYIIGQRHFYLSQAIAVALGVGVAAILIIWPLPLLLQPLLAFVLIGSTLITARTPITAKRTEQFAQMVAARRLFVKEPRRSIYETCDWVTLFTKNISDAFVRSGIRMSIWLCCAYLIAIEIYEITALIVRVIFIIVSIVVFLIIASFIIRIISVIGGNKEPTSDPTPWFLNPLSGIFKSLGKGWWSLLRPPKQYELVKKGNRETLVVNDVTKREFTLSRKNSETLETTNVFGSPVQIRQSNDAIGLPDPNRFEVHDSDGNHLGNLVRTSPDERFEFEDEEEIKE